MKKNIQVSVIVPVYNTSSYLEKCINSLLEQTFTDYEIIVVNDGSTDHSSELLASYTHHNNIKIFHKENGGLSDARNFGIKQATGNYLAFVDSDDWVEKDFLEIMYNLTFTYNADIALCNLQKVDENNIVFNQIDQLTHLPEVINLNTDFSFFGEISSFACNKLFKKELFTYEQFPLGLHFEDIATIPRLFLKSKIITRTNKYLYNYFERRGSISQSFNEKGMDMFQAIALVKDSYKNSVYSLNNKEWKRFVIFQGFYSFLAYIIRTKDKELRLKMFFALQELLKKENISKRKIFTYKRLNKTYLTHLPVNKMLFYIFMLTFPHVILKYY